MPTEVQIYKDGTIVEADIANNAVTVDKIGTGAVTDIKIGTGAVTVDKIGTGAVTDIKIGTGAVTVDKIGTGAVTPGKLSTGGPSWNTSGNLSAGSFVANGGGNNISINAGLDGSIELYRSGDGGSYIDFVRTTGQDYDVRLDNFTASTLKITGNLRVTGDVTAYSDSDQRLKDNITPIPNALDKVLSISGNTFDWNDKSEKEGNDVGVIAQEIIEVLPEAVTTRDTGYLAVRYEKLVPLLIEAIKEQQETITNLQNRIEILEGK